MYIDIEDYIDELSDDILIDELESRGYKIVENKHNTYLEEDLKVLIKEWFEEYSRRLGPVTDSELIKRIKEEIE